MWNDRLIRGALAGVALLTAGCETGLHQSDYSADYIVNLPDRNTPFPDACLEADAEGLAETQLPPGCANALNLMQMVERPSELQRGAEPAPALAAPVGRAMQRYLVPAEDRDEERRRELEEEASAATGVIP